MIRRLTEALNLPNELAQNEYGRRFRALQTSYGLGYEFCRFYELMPESVYGVVLNASMTLCGNGPVDFEELSAFLMLNDIHTLEMPSSLGGNFAPVGYQRIPRVLFEFQPGPFPPDIPVQETPPLDAVFDVLRTSFPLEGAYALWLTDTSHQIRHGIGRVYLYKGTTATMHSCMDGVAFFGQIATLPENRGQGHARELLYWLENRMAEARLKARLFARPERVSFYQGLGFSEVGQDILFEKETI